MSRVFHVRSEGTASSSGTTGSPNIIISFSFYESSPSDVYFSIKTHSRPTGVSGVFTASTLVSSYTVTNGSSYRARSTGTNTCTLDVIGYIEPPALSSLPAVLWEWNNTTDVPSTAVDDFNKIEDDNYIKLYIPWTVTFLGTNYATGDVYLGSNTYLTFGAGSTQWRDLDATNPNLPKIMIGCGDNSFQRVSATSGAIVTPTLGSFNMTRTFGDSAFIITQPTSVNTAGAFTYSVITGSDVISMSGTTITIIRAGTATVQASQAASGKYLLATKTATITINRATPTLVTSQSIIYRKFVSGATFSFDFISSSAGAVSRTYESTGPSPLIITIPTASAPSASIVAPGKTTIKVTQPQTTNYSEIVSTLITIVIIGQGQTYTSEIFSSVDLSGTNLSGSTFSNCTLTDTNLFGTTVSSTTNFTSSTLKGIMSGKIIGTTDLLPPGYRMI